MFLASHLRRRVALTCLGLLTAVLSLPAEIHRSADFYGEFHTASFTSSIFGSFGSSRFSGAGVSLLPSSVAPTFYNADLVRNLHQHHNVQIIRASISGRGFPNGDDYAHNPERHLALISNVVDAAIAEGIYVIIAWEEDTSFNHLELAQRVALPKQFFRTMALKYRTRPNVIYQLLGTPSDTSWDQTLRPFAELLVAEIRSIDDDNIILLPSPQFNTDIPAAVANPIVAPYLAYAFDFFPDINPNTGFAPPPELYQRLTALNVPVLVTGWGSEANGPFQQWIRDNAIPSVGWVVSNLEQHPIKFNTFPDQHPNVTGPWNNTELTTAGRILFDFIRTHPGNQPPAPSHFRPALSSLPDQYILADTTSYFLDVYAYDLSPLAKPLTAWAVLHSDRGTSSLFPSVTQVDGRNFRLQLPYTLGETGTFPVMLIAGAADRFGAENQHPFTVRVFSKGPITDRNDDGISDIWAAVYNMQGGPSDDPDGDGQSNWHEAQAGTDPNMASSRFSASLATHADGSLWLHWGPYLSTKKYRLEHSTDLNTWTTVPDPQTTTALLPSSHTDTTLTMATKIPGTPTSGTARYWRMTVYDYQGIKPILTGYNESSTLNEWEKTQDAQVSTIVTRPSPRWSFGLVSTVRIPKGDSQVFTITAGVGSTLDQVTFDGVDVTSSVRRESTRTYSYTVSNAPAGLHVLENRMKADPSKEILTGRSATASGTENTNFTPNQLIDNNPTTRWASGPGDTHWVKIDLGGVYHVNKVVLSWGAAFAKTYQIESSIDGNTWAPISGWGTTSGKGGTETLEQLLFLTPKARYLRLNMTQRGTQWGYSLWEFRVFAWPE